MLTPLFPIHMRLGLCIYHLMVCNVSQANFFIKVKNKANNYV